MLRKQKPARTVLCVEALEERCLLSGGVLDPTHEATAEFLGLLQKRGVDATSHQYTEQINGFFSIMSIPTGERTLQSLVRTVRGRIASGTRRAAVPGPVAAGTA